MTGTTFSKKPTPQGFNCATCGDFHPFTAYVYAHWLDVLVHNCAQCGAVHDLLNGRADQTKPGVVPA